MNITGGCLCGAVRYHTLAGPISVRQCYCRVCQYLAAGNASVSALFRAADVVFTSGEQRKYIRTADSGNIMHRRFCPQCGTPISNQGEARPDFLTLRVGTMDNPNAVKPTAAIWVDAAPEWACIDPSLERIAGQPQPKS